MIKIVDLSLKIDSNFILKNINLEFQPSSIYRLVGANGCGKTTLIESIIGINDFADGKIDIKNSEISYLPQVAHQNPKLQLKLGDLCQCEFSFYDKSLFNKNWHQASGGERKKTLIARILSREADVYILDEPFNHLDQDSIELVISSLVKLKDIGKTVIYTGHEHSIDGEIIVEVKKWK